MDTLPVRAVSSHGSKSYVRCLFVKYRDWHAVWIPIFVLAQGITFCSKATAQFHPPGPDCPTAPSATLDFVNDSYIDIVYDTWDGQLFLEYERSFKVSGLVLESRSEIFTGKCLGVGGFFDICTPAKVATIAYGEGDSLSDVVAYAQLGLDREYLQSDLLVDFSPVVPFPPWEPIPWGCLYLYQPPSREERSHIDWLTQQINVGVGDRVLELLLDLNDDGLVDGADRTIWVKDVAKTWFGDANLNGEFNTGDLTLVLEAGKYETQEYAGWSEGDWNGDGVFGTGDIVKALDDGGYELGPQDPAAVPEPATWLLLSLGLPIAMFRQRRR